MIRRPPRSTPLYSSAASDVYKRQRHNLGKTIGVFAHLGAPPWQFPWQTIAALAARGTQPVGAMGPWQSSGASTVTPSLRRVRAGALCDMLFKVQQPKRPGKDSRVGLEIYLRGVRCRVRHDGRVKLLCELNTIHMAKCAAFAPQRRLEVPNGGNVHRPSPQVVPDWTA